MNIETASYVVVGLLLGPGVLIVGIVLLARASSARRRVQLQFADWLHSQGYEMPAPFGMPPGTPPGAGGVPPRITYPPEVLKTGSGMRVAGWILLSVGVLVMLGRLASVGNAMS